MQHGDFEEALGCYEQMDDSEGKHVPLGTNTTPLLNMGTIHLHSHNQCRET
jgi:hypothetical protein